MDKITEGKFGSEEKAEIINRLANKFNAILSLAESDMGERTTRSLALMSDLEVARTELNGFCETVGEGDNRSVVLTAGVDRYGEEKIDWTTNSNQPQDIGISKGAYREYLFVNRKGIFKLSLRVKQEVNLSPYAEEIINQTNQTDLNRVTEWCEQMTMMVETDGRRHEAALRDVIAQKAYEPFPDEDVRLNKYPTESRSKWEVSQQLDPSVPLAGVQADREFDVRDRITGFRAEVRQVRVTKPDFVVNALTASSTHQTSITA